MKTLFEVLEAFETIAAALEAKVYKDKEGFLKGLLLGLGWAADDQEAAKQMELLLKYANEDVRCPPSKRRLIMSVHKAKTAPITATGPAAKNKSRPPTEGVRNTGPNSPDI